MNKSADWLAWCLQFVFGLIVGTIFGTYSNSWLRPSLFGLGTVPSTYFVGAALIGAGLASFYGDRLWIGLSYRVIAPDEIRHSVKSRIFSIITGVIGGILVLTAVIKHFAVI